MAHCGDLCHKTESNINEIIVKKLKMTYLGSKVFFINGPTPASFCLFSFFSTQIVQKNNRLQRDSNSDRRSRR